MRRPNWIDYNTHTMLKLLQPFTRSPLGCRIWIVIKSVKSGEDCLRGAGDSRCHCRCTGECELMER